jgi:CheY-like chemotaxis protein
MHLLLIDDNDDLITGTAELLRRAGHAVRSGRNGQEAVRLLEDQAADLLITDILMPEQDGLGLILKVRCQFPSLPIIAMSGAGAPNELYLAIAAKLGAVATLTKPFSRAQLLNAIARVSPEREHEPAG